MTDEDTAERFLVVPGSESAHCCFTASVVDLNAPVLDGEGEIIDGRFATICECFSMDAAEQIAAALNAPEEHL